MTACAGPLPCARIPLDVPGLTHTTELAAGALRTCAIAAAGVLCWGVDQSQPVPVTLPTAVHDLVAGAGVFCALTLPPAGQAYCWGSGSPPAPVDQGSLRFTALAAGYIHQCGLTDQAHIYGWGDNAAGELGTGDRTSSATPVAVAPPS
ncbi:MAG TPA: hypothetical protein VMG41_13385 [Gemmatimonadales bacterium]|nr:hypothetical protein [Gemmatimonadales bacterium]